MSSVDLRIRPLRQRLLALATVVVALFVILDLVAPVARADTYTLDLPLIVAHGAPGSELVLFEGPLPVSGEQCRLVVSRVSNNHSVHPGNDLRLESNGQVVNFWDVERAPDAETPGDGVMIPGETGKLVLTFGSDHQFSASIQLVFECVPLSTTTTTAPATTSSSTNGETTTTGPGGGSTTTFGDTTTIPEAPTTTPPEDTTTIIGATSTSAAATSTTSGAEETTTTIAGVSTSIGGPTTTIGGTGTTPPDEVLGTQVLPFTGLDSSRLGLVAVVLIAVGSLLGLAVREGRDH